MNRRRDDEQLGTLIVVLVLVLTVILFPATSSAADLLIIDEHGRVVIRCTTPTTYVPDVVTLVCMRSDRIYLDGFENAAN